LWAQGDEPEARTVSPLERLAVAIRGNVDQIPAPVAGFGEKLARHLLAEVGAGRQVFPSPEALHRRVNAVP
jgi:hypothetical protein